MNKLKVCFITLLAFLIGIASIEAQQSTQDPEKAQLIRVIPSECNDHLDPDRIRDRIVYKELKADTLYLHLGFGANCCQEFLPEIEFKSNELHVVLDTTTEVIAHCACNCCFEVTLLITGIPDTSFSTWISMGAYSDEKEWFVSKEQFKTYPEAYDIIEGDTVNRYNKYHLKEGPWYSYYDTTEVLRSIVCFDGLGDQFHNHYDILWRKGFYRNGNLKYFESRDSASFYHENGMLQRKHFYTELGFLHARYTEIEYDENGQVKSKCKVTYDEWADEDLKREDCVYWDRK